MYTWHPTANVVCIACVRTVHVINRSLTRDGNAISVCRVVDEMSRGAFRRVGQGQMRRQCPDRLSHRHCAVRNLLCSLLALFSIANRELSVLRTLTVLHHVACKCTCCVGRRASAEHELEAMDEMDSMAFVLSSEWVLSIICVHLPCLAAWLCFPHGTQYQRVANSVWS